MALGRGKPDLEGGGAIGEAYARFDFPHNNSDSSRWERSARPLLNRTSIVIDGKVKWYKSVLMCSWSFMSIVLWVILNICVYKTMEICIWESKWVICYICLCVMHADVQACVYVYVYLYWCVCVSPKPLFVFLLYFIFFIPFPFIFLPYHFPNFLIFHHEERRQRKQ